MGPARALDLALSGGDDYELCFSVPAARLAELTAAAQQGGCPVRCIGQLQAAPGLWLWQDGRLAPYEARGYDHFTNGG